MTRLSVDVTCLTCKHHVCAQNIARTTALFEYCEDALLHIRDFPKHRITIYLTQAKSSKRAKKT
jgi:hypothetical protein